MGMYDSLRICPSVGARLVIVQFVGIGSAAGPPAKILRGTVGSALAEANMPTARSVPKKVDV